MPQVLKIVLVVIGLTLVKALLLMFAWNLIIPLVFGLMMLDYGQSILMVFFLMTVKLSFSRYQYSDD